MNSPVKSAARVLEVFECFDRVQRPASVTEIARVLGYPQSSTSELLRSLVAPGYLESEPEDRRSCSPTARLPLPGAWLQPPLAVGIGGWSKSIRDECQRFVRLMRKGIRKRLGGVPPMRSAA